MKNTRILLMSGIFVLVLAATVLSAQSTPPAETAPVPAGTAGDAVTDDPGIDPDPGRRGHGRQRRAREGGGQGCCGGCSGAGWQADRPGRRCQGRGPDLSALTTTRGEVMAYEGGPGQRMPTLTVVVEDEWLEIFVGPNRVWRDAAFQPEVGQELEVTYAPATSKSHLVAISVTDPATGQTVALRDSQSGKPVGGGRGGGRCGRV